MKGSWRKAYQKQEWSKQVDISTLYQMETATAHIRAIAEQEQIQPILEQVSLLERALATAQGKVTHVDLAAAQMPEDESAKIPDPRLDISHLHSSTSKARRKG